MSGLEHVNSDSAVAENRDIPVVNMFLRRDCNHDQRRYNLLTVDEVALIFHFARGRYYENLYVQYEVVTNFDHNNMLKMHTAEQSSFANHIVMVLNFLQSIMSQYDYALKTCNVDLYLKIGTLLPEMAAHEKSLDFYIDLLQKNQLDETSSMELLDKLINFFQQQYAVNVLNEEVNCTMFMSDHCRLVLSACDAIGTDIGHLKVLIQPGQENTEISILL